MLTEKREYDFHTGNQSLVGKDIKAVNFNNTIMSYYTSKVMCTISKDSLKTDFLLGHH